MCGRYTLKTPSADLVDAFDLLFEPDFVSPRYNIAPSQPVAGIRQLDGARQMSLFQWGLIPFWAKDKNIGYKMINARGETLHEKPSFREAFKKRRCLIAVDGFYEWERSGKRKNKQPFHIRRSDQQPFAFAGLWESWKSPDGSPLESCTIVTTTPNDLLETIHDRMPVILDPSDYNIWLDPTFDHPEVLRELIKPYSGDDFEMYAVSQEVNNAQNEVAGLHIPQLPQKTGKLFE
jgi:putative SOS response-associated peptidase YedK